MPNKDPEDLEPPGVNPVSDNDTDFEPDGNDVFESDAPATESVAHHQWTAGEQAMSDEWYPKNQQNYSETVKGLRDLTGIPMEAKEELVLPEPKYLILRK